MNASILPATERQISCYVGCYIIAGSRLWKFGTKGVKMVFVDLVLIRKAKKLLSHTKLGFRFLLLATLFVALLVLKCNFFLLLIFDLAY